MIQLSLSSNFIHHLYFTQRSRRRERFCADEGIGDKLIAFEKEQLAGEKLNEVAVKYFMKHPRDFDAAWPSEVATDKDLRHFMTTMIDADPAEIKKEAKKQLGLDLD